MIPNHKSIVERVNSEHPHLVNQNTAATVREFYWRAVTALHAHDPKWGMLTKSQSENHQVIAGHRVAVDAVAYQGADQVVDILKAAGDGPGKGGVSWGLATRRASNIWLDPPPFPTGGDDGDPGDEDDPPPPPDDEHDSTVDELSDKLTILRIEHDALKGTVSTLSSRVEQMQAQINELLDADPDTDDSAEQLAAIYVLLEKVAAKLGV